MKGLTFTLVFSSAEEAVEFLKMLEKSLPGKSFLGELKTNKVKIFVPESEDSERLVHRIRELYNQMRSPHAQGLVRDYDIATLFSMSRLEIPISVSILVDALKIKGFKVEVVKDKLRTNAPPSDLTKTVESLSRIYRELVDLRMTAQSRRLVALYSYIENLAPSESIRRLSELGILTEESGRISLKVNYEAAIKTLYGARKT